MLRMAQLARWHIWLAWLAGVPILMWTVTGLVMVSRPIEQVRGEHLRKPVAETVLPASGLALPEAGDGPYREMRAVMQQGRPVWLLTDADGAVTRRAADGAPLAAIDEAAVRALVANRIVGGGSVERIARFSADEAPVDFRREMPVWQVALADGTRVYVGAETGEIEAVRTRWWRLFDLMWGLHIMDLEAREDTSHPVLILFAALAAIASLLGVVLMFRRRRVRVR